MTETFLASADPVARRAIGGLLFVVGYVALEWVSFLHPLHGIAITPWSPADGLSFAVLLLGGYTWIPAVFLATSLSSVLISDVFVPVSTVLLSSAIIAAGYGIPAGLLRRRRLKAPFSGPANLSLLLAVAVTAPALVAIVLVAMHAATGIVPSTQFTETVWQSWLGDAIGIAVMTPFVLVIKDWLETRSTPTARDVLQPYESCLQYGTLILAFVVVFGPIGGQEPFKFFYVLFLPLVWIAARQGLLGAAWAVVATQAGLIIVYQFLESPIRDVRSFQLLMLCLTITTLLLGAMVSERRRALVALRASELRLASILNAVPDGLIMLDAAAQIQAANPAVERLFGISEDRLLGRAVSDFISVPGVALLAPGNANPANETGEFSGRRLDGSRFPIELSTAAQEIDGEPHRILVLRDITSRQQAEMRVRAHQLELARVSRLSIAGQMASALAHELNQPLTAVVAYLRGCLRLLQQQPLQPVLLREGLDEAVVQAERAGVIINRLREFLYDGVSHRTATDVSEIIDAVLDLARPELVQNGVALNLVIPPGLPRVMVERIQIEQVLLNLVRNAIEAMIGAEIKEPQITITAESEGQTMIRIGVSDVGPGIADDIAPRLFRPCTTTKVHGMGLGLSISQSILHAHGTELKITSDPGEGAAFAFKLPVFPE